MYLAHTPKFVQKLFPNFIWNIPNAQQEIFITFDDGPIPHVTPWVLAQLSEFNAKATFFCVGENVQKHPDIYQQVIEDGHTVGNHTHNHLSGWSEANATYIQNIRACSKHVQTDLFRPPYGRIKVTQALSLQQNYHIIMWDVLSGDFDAKISPQQCLENITRHAKNGSIIVLHDSLKTIEKLEFVLPKMLRYFASQGYTFSALTAERISSRLQQWA